MAKIYNALHISDWLFLAGKDQIQGVLKTLFATLSLSQVCVLLLAFLAPLSCLGHPYSLVTTAKADTDYSVPEQLFLVCHDQGSTDFSEGNLGTDPDQNTIVPRAVSAVLRCAALPDVPKIHLGALEFLFEFQLGYDMDPSCAWRTLSWKTQTFLRALFKGKAGITTKNSPPHLTAANVNSSSITQFLLLTFADTLELQLLTFGLFLGIYLVALLANGLIITAIACDHHLHTPMYFFLFNLAVLDLGSLSTTLPKAMANALWNTRAISYTGCVAQLFLFAFFLGAEYFLLTVMAYDRYVAICKPLHYGTLLGSRACVHMAAAAWGTAFPYAVLHTANTFSLPLCQGNAVDQFFCEIPQILKLSCSDTYLREAGVVVVSVCLGFGCFVFIVVSYVQIFRAVLRIPSEQGRHKAFSTCLPHLAVVSLFVSTAMFAHLKPPSISSRSLDLVMAFLYSVVPPAVNPLIYSMRNKELRDAVSEIMTGCY
ncbi:olfactory receptor 14C36-like [Leptosomus discolor]